MHWKDILCLRGQRRTPRSMRMHVGALERNSTCQSLISGELSWARLGGKRETHWQDQSTSQGTRFCKISFRMVSACSHKYVTIFIIWKGLHFNPEGYRLMYSEVMKVIREQIPDQSPEKLPSVYPPWEQAPAWSSALEVANEDVDSVAVKGGSQWTQSAYLGERWWSLVRNKRYPWVPETITLDSV